MYEIVKYLHRYKRNFSGHLYHIHNKHANGQWFVRLKMLKYIYSDNLLETFNIYVDMIIIIVSVLNCKIPAIMFYSKFITIFVMNRNTEIFGYRIFCVCET